MPTLPARLRAALPELSRFGTVGLLSLVVDSLVFNLVLHVLPDKPLTAKGVAAVVATTNAFVLNRHWSFKDRTRTRLHREYAQFFLINAIGLGISLACLFTSHYVLGLESRLADNVASYGFGLALGTAFRFWAYRRWVWVRAEEPDPEPALAR